MRSFRCHDRSRGTHVSKPIRHTSSREVGDSFGRPKSVPMSAAEGVVRTDTLGPDPNRETRFTATPPSSAVSPELALIDADLARELRAQLTEPAPPSRPPSRRGEPRPSGHCVRSSSRGRGSRHPSVAGDPASSESSGSSRWARCSPCSCGTSRARPFSTESQVSQLTRTPKPKRPSSASRPGPSPPARRPLVRPSSGRPSQARRRTSSSSSAATIGSIELASRPRDSISPAAGGRAGAPIP